MQAKSFVFVVIIQMAITRMLKLKECNYYEAQFSKIQYDKRLRNSTCQLLGNAAQRNLTNAGTATFVFDKGWNHFETDYNKKAVGIFG